MSTVSLKNIVKIFSNQEIIPSLNLEIGDKEFISLLGPSGCGKTTLIRMIAGLEHPTQGTITIGSDTVFNSQNNIFVPPEKRHVGMVFQSYALWPHLSVFENVAFPLRCQNVDKADIKTRCDLILSQVKLSGLQSRMPNQLSGGQQQRVALARALVSKPRLLLLDEPLSNLDSNLREEMCEQILLLRKAHPVTMVYVTHDQKEAFRLSDRIVLLNQGRIEQIGLPSELINHPKSDFVRGFMKSQE